MEDFVLSLLPKENKHKLWYNYVLFCVHARTCVIFVSGLLFFNYCFSVQASYHPRIHNCHEALLFNILCVDVIYKSTQNIIKQFFPTVLCLCTSPSFYDQQSLPDIFDMVSHIFFIYSLSDIFFSSIFWFISFWHLAFVHAGQFFLSMRRSHISWKDFDSFIQVDLLAYLTSRLLHQWTDLIIYFAFIQSLIH